MPPTAPQTMPHATRPSYLRSLSSFSKDKPRLYIALYPRTSSCSAHCDSYHWALIIGPATSSRKDPATRFHLAHSTTTTPLDDNSGTHASYLEENELSESPRAQRALLIRVAVAKIADLDRTRKILRSLRPRHQVGSYYTCFHWVQEAFAALHAESAGGCLRSYFGVGDWEFVEKCAREYCRSKKRQGRFVEGVGTVGVGGRRWREEDVSTFNAWERRETVP